MIESLSNFSFSEENKLIAVNILKKYPVDRKNSAVMPLLDIAQRQNDGWLSRDTIEYVAEYLGMPIIKVMEVVTFYTMYHTKPVGKHLIQVCTTTPCWLRGSDNVIKACKEIISPEQNTVSNDGLFSWMKVECLGACVNAPMVQINEDYYEDLDYESAVKIVKSLKEGKSINIGSQIGRKSSEPFKKEENVR